ncbi:MAG: penicillin-binding protein 2 [Parvularculaceae bacterium]
MAWFGRRKSSTARCYIIAETAEAAPPRAGVKALSGRARLASRAKKRIAMCAFAFCAAYGLLAGRLAFVSLSGDGAPGGANTEIAANDAGPRPEILDRNGVLLATNLPMVALEIAGREVWDPKETARALASAFPEIDEASLEQKLEEGRYVEALSNLTPAEQDKAFALGLPGVRFSARTRRFYPLEHLASHVVGHTEPGKGGVMGLEGVLDAKKMHGPLVASIDTRVQQTLEDELAAAIETHHAEAGWGAIMDAATGEIIALASFPDFNPNEPGASPADWRRNRATYDRYELGSAFKTLTAAAALDAGAAKESSIYDARGAYRVANKTIRDFHGENRMLSLSEVIQFSSNIGAARIAADLGTERQRAYLKSLGLFEALPIELRENRPTELPPQWGPVETATISYGHGISVTPLHLLAAFTAVVNGGKYRTPTFLKTDRKRASHEVFSPEVSKTMRRVLRRVVTDGTASYADAAGYYPIGKTATADKVIDGRYANNARIASFVGAFPGYAPRYTVLVSLDNPQPSKATFGYATAGWNAAPMFARIVERIAPSLGVMPVNEETAQAAFFDDTGDVTANASYGAGRRNIDVGEDGAHEDAEAGVVGGVQ